MRTKIVETREEGQERIVSKFLLFPKRIGDERRWLEKANIKQILHFHTDFTNGAAWWEWKDIEWVENI